jgi:hypothetical protein
MQNIGLFPIKLLKSVNAIIVYIVITKNEIEKRGDNSYLFLLDLVALFWPA